MKILTIKQRIIFDAICDFYNEHNYSPTLKELCKKTKHKSVGTMSHYLKILKKEGYIDFSESKNRNIKIIVNNKK